MHVDAGDSHALQLRGARIDLTGTADRNAELVLGLAGRDLGMGTRIDVGIDANGNWNCAALSGGDRSKKFKLGFGLDVDAENAFVDGQREFARRLADTGEHDLIERNAGGPG